MKSFLTLIALVAIALVAFFVWRSTPSGYVFTPYESTTLREGNPPSEAQRQTAERELVQFQKSLGAFTEAEDFNKKLNTLTLISEYQQILGKYSDAKRTLETALTLEVNPKLLQSYAQLLFTMGAREGAIPYINDAIMFVPETPELWRLKIDMLSELHKDDLTIVDKTYLDAIKATDNHIDIVTMYAASLSHQGRKEEAIKYWKLAQKVLPSRINVYQQEIDSLQ